MAHAAKIFVSYSHSDSDRVLPVIEVLREDGIDVWYDDNLTPGIDWNEELARAIEACSVCLFFVSEASLASAVCEREVSLAVRIERYVLPVYLEDVPLSPTMELGIGNLQAIRQPPASAQRLTREIKPLIEHVLETGIPEPGRRVHTRVHTPRVGHYRASPPPRYRQAVSLALAALALGALGFLALNGLRPDRIPEVGTRLAVLVFENFSGDAANDYLGSGLAEELVDALTRIEVLRVVPRTASFYFHGKDVAFSAIVEALDVDVVLEGSLLERNGDELRFSTQLIDVRTDAHIWSNIYEVELESLADIKRDITHQVQVALAVGAGTPAVEQPPAFDGVAYDLYLRGKEGLRRQHTREDQEEAEALFRQALDIDADFAPALAGWCQTRLEMFVLSRSRDDFLQATDVCRSVADADPAAADALVALGTLARLENKIDEALQHYEQALALNADNEPALYGISRCYEARGDFAAAERFAIRSIELLPRYWKAYTGYAGFLYRRGRYLEAAEQSLRVAELVPDNPVGWGNLGASYFAADHWEDAAVAWERAFALDPTRHGYGNLATLYYYQHNFTAAARMLEQGIERFPEDHRLLGKLAAVYRLDAARKDQAEALYKRAFETTSGALSVNPEDAVLLSHHAYFAAAIGLPKNASDAMARALVLSPDNPEVHYLAAYVRLLSDHPDGWSGSYNRALELGYSKRQAASDPMFDSTTAVSLSG